MQVPTLMFLILLMLLSVNGKRKESKRKNEVMEKYREDTEKNICNRSNRNQMIACTCDSEVINNATNVQCWIFSDPEAVAEATWDHFLFQRNIKEIKFGVRVGGRLSVVPPILPYLEELEKLEILYGAIHELRPYAFGNSSKLRELVLSQNEIHMLHPNAFAHLAGLQTITLDENNFREIQPMIFHHVPRLRKLFMVGCNISIIHDNAFRFVNNLNELELNKNDIAIITRETFNGLFRLQSLQLRSNRLSMLGDYTFAEMPELIELDLDLNRIEYISFNAFSGLHRLMKLRMSENKLKTMIPGIFKDFVHLQLMDLRDNGIIELKYELMEPLWENFKNVSSQLFLDGNALPCDCRLNWMYVLRNESANQDLRMAFQQLTCVIDPKYITEPPLASSEFQDDQQIDSNGVEYSLEDVEYEELDDPELEWPPRKRIFDIPIEELPCPENLVATSTTIQPFREITKNTLFSFSSSANVNSLSIFSFLLLLGIWFQCM